MREAELNVRRFQRLWHRAVALEPRLEALWARHDAMGVLELLDEPVAVKKGRPRDYNKIYLIGNIIGYELYNYILYTILKFMISISYRAQFSGRSGPRCPAA